MSAHAIPAEHQDDPGQQAADAQQHRQALRDLIGMGTDFARLLHGRATAQATQDAHDAPPSQPTNTPPAPTPSPPPADALIPLAAAFDRIARAVRRCILLARSLDAPAPSACDPARHRAAARRRIIREVEDAIHRTNEGDPADALHAELHERMDTPDLDDDLSTRPIAEIVTELRRDLGLATLPGDHAWHRRTPDDIAHLNARAAAQPGARQPTAAPHAPGRDDAQRPPDPQPHRPATPHAQPGPVHASPDTDLPDDPAEAIATILRGPALAEARWRPPPEG